jgi:hypothetical protein
VVGEWQFDERRPQQKLDVVVPLADTEAEHDDLQLEEEEEGKDDAVRRMREEQQAEKEAFLDAWSRFLFSKR